MGGAGVERVGVLEVAMAAADGVGERGGEGGDA